MRNSHLEVQATVVNPPLKTAIAAKKRKLDDDVRADVDNGGADDFDDADVLDKKRARLQKDYKVIIQKTMDADLVWAADALMSDPTVSIKHCNMCITHHDLSTLIPGRRLNDEIINFYLKVIIPHPDVYVYTTFFYSKLVSKGEYDYSSVKNYTKRVDIFNKRLVVFPIHRGVHWTLATYYPKKLRLRYCNSMDDVEMSQHDDIKVNLHLYLRDEWTEKKGSTPPSSHTYTGSRVPQQGNGVDCGVFVCMFAVCEVNGLSMATFTERNVADFRRHMALTIAGVEPQNMGWLLMM